MKRALQMTLPMLLAILVNLLTLGAHGSAMATSSSLSSQNMTHGGKASLSCITICAASSLKKQKVGSAQDEKNNDHTPPFYIDRQQSIIQAFNQEHGNRAKTASALRPPPGPPSYVVHSVLRF